MKLELYIEKSSVYLTFAYNVPHSSPLKSIRLLRYPEILPLTKLSCMSIDLRQLRRL